MKPTAAIFDLDGVIVDTARFHYLAWKKVATALGFDLTHAQNEALKGVSRVDSLQKIVTWSGTQITQAQFDRFLVEKNNDYLHYIEALTPEDALPGVRWALEELQSAGIRIALGSASKNARKILDQLVLTQYFDTIVDGNDTQASKPNPEVFLKGAAALQVDPQNCVVFEDAQAGIEAAIAAMMKPIGIGDATVLDRAAHCIPGFSSLTAVQLLNFFNKE
jgi:beta-phosphoglucomutase